MINANPVVVKYLLEYINSPWWVPKVAMGLENGFQHCGVLVTLGSESDIGINDYICMLSCYIPKIKSFIRHFLR